MCRFDGVIIQGDSFSLAAPDILSCGNFLGLVAL